MKSQSIKGWLVDVVAKSITPAEVVFCHGVITAIRPARESECLNYILPGFVDAHVHIESSLLPPREFARLAVVHGTVATVSDPHEIANVMGLSGVEYMLNQGEWCPMKIYFGAPSCVPATSFETAGGAISVSDVEQLLDDPRVKYLAEVMNFPGVLQNDPQLKAMIAAAKRRGKQVDGHAPGIRGDDAKCYAAAGITTDHECFTQDEARDKLAAGMSIIIREGSAAKNFAALIDLLNEFPDRIMFGTDDAHPDYLLEGHINLSVKRALAHGVSFFDAIRAATLNPVRHYQLDVGLLQKGDPADFIVVGSLQELDVLKTYVRGIEVANRGKALFAHETAPLINNFNRNPICRQDIHVVSQGPGSLRAIKVLPGQLVTEELLIEHSVNHGGPIDSDVSRDILKLVVVNRYNPQTSVTVGFVNGFELTAGALASSVAHDSHNIIAVGCNDEDLLQAINMVIASTGGLCVANGSARMDLQLPIAGLMSGLDGHTVARCYQEMDAYVKNELGSTLPAPFMSLSFLALLVIPSLKLGDRGLFDGNNFKFVDLQLQPTGPTVEV